MMNFIVGGVLLLVIALAVRSLWRNHRDGKSCGGCDGDCAHCQGHHE